MRKELITEAARSLWGTYRERNPHRLCEYLEISVEALPIELKENSIKALVVRSSRCYSIVENSDLSCVQQDSAIFNEIGHVVLGHAKLAPCTCRSLFSTRKISMQEIEAIEFIAEYLMDTEDTMSTLFETGNFFDSARILRVPPAIMDFKWRMLA